ncbi:hypothetical protein CRYUN_Cryun35bG0049100 [Craigia yunnanensis]
MMLQRAASNAYSWWWASHIRTKQSKWLEQNLEDMEEKVTSMLNIIDDEGDSFAQRAEMYYKKRPKLVSIVEESYRAYRALAERYDHLSKDLKSANRTIASVFPEQVPFAMDEEDEENVSQASTSSSSPHKPGVSKPSVPKAPFSKKDFRSQSMLLSKGQLKKAFSSSKTVAFPSSGLSKNEAVDEIDKLQKEILAMQTEREFVKSSCEQGYQIFCEIENQITEKQKRVFYLQDEFGVGSVIDDNEARTLMATTALKSCQESLATLKEKHEQSTEEARVESERIKHVNQKFEALRNKYNSPQTNQQEKPRYVSPTSEVDNMVYEIDSVEKERQDLEELRKEFEEKLEVSSNPSLTMSQLVEKIDDLVQRVVSLETAVLSENALVKGLTSDADELQARVKSLEEDKEALIEGSDITNNRMNELEGELSRVKDLVKTVVDQNNSFKTHFTEASCNINHLSVKLQAVKMDEEVENTGLSEEIKTGVDAKPDLEMEEHQIELVPGDSSALKDTGIKMEGMEKDVSAEGRNYVDCESSNKFDVDSEKGSEPMEENKAEKKYLSETSSIPDTEIEELENDEEEEQPNWRQLYLNGLDDREKILLGEYSSVLQNYKEVRKKLNEVDKKNRDGFFELALQIRELKNALASRDGENQSLRQKKSFEDENKNGNLVESEVPRLSASQESTLTDSILTSPVAVGQGKVESIEKIFEHGRFKESPKKIVGNIRQIKHVSQPRPVLTVEDKIQSVLKDEVQGRYSSLCNIQEEIARVTKVSGQAGETELNGYQAAKFQGEVLNMKQENKKISNELKAGFDRVRQLEHEVEEVMANLERELGASTSTTQHSGSRTGWPRIPLRSFLFGIKLKNRKQLKGPSMFASRHPTLQKQLSYLTEPAEPSR